MKKPLIALIATALIAAAALVAYALSPRVEVSGDDDSAWPMEWTVGQVTYRTDTETADCRIRITTEVIAPEGLEEENRVLTAHLADLDPAAIQTTAANPVLGLPGLVTLTARPEASVRCELLSGQPCPTPERARAELQLPPYWADRPDDFARLIRADIERCSETK